MSANTERDASPQPELSASLRKCRSLIRSALPRAEYLDRIRAYASGIRAMAEVQSIDLLPATLELINKCDNEAEGLAVMAAYVEIVDPTPGSANVDDVLRGGA